MELLEFVYYPNAVRPDLLADEDWQAVEQALLANPAAGAVVAATGGAQATGGAAWARQRGGARTIYYYAGERGAHLLPQDLREE